MRIKLRKIDIGAERRKLENFTKMGKSRYYDVECPFCHRHTLAYCRNFHAGIRCANENCRAKLRYCLNEAVRDMVPVDEAVEVPELADGKSRVWIWKGCAE